MPSLKFSRSPDRVGSAGRKARPGSGPGSGWRLRPPNARPGRASAGQSAVPVAGGGQTGPGGRPDGRSRPARRPEANPQGLPEVARKPPAKPAPATRRGLRRGASRADGARREDARAAPRDREARPHRTGRTNRSPRARSDGSLCREPMPPSQTAERRCKGTARAAGVAAPDSRGLHSREGAIEQRRARVATVQLERGTKTRRARWLQH